MTIAIVAQPTNSPPRFQITIATPDGSAITAVTLNRTANGSTMAVRAQPPASASPIVTYDYEAPWDTVVSYSATVTRGGTTETYTSDQFTLSPSFPWLIHPTTPTLSLPLDRNSFDLMGVVSIGDETRGELKNKHRILGSEYQIVTKTGPRAAPTLPMVIATVTNDERAAMVALVRDQTPLLIQAPTSFLWDFENGYYDVGDFSTGRILQYGAERRRTITMQLERVEAPAGTQQPTRTWANVLAQNASWNDVVARYATWSDLLTDTRR